MRSKAAVGTARAGWSRREFEQRAEPSTLPEWMDEPCDGETLRGCLRDLAEVNRLTMSYPPTLRFLRRAMDRQRDREVHILDVGCGYGDTLRVIHRWARRRRLRVRLTGIDLNSFTAAIAREATAEAGLPPEAIAWRSGDAFELGGEEAPDIVISSLVTHHLGREELLRFLRFMESTARVGWFINDLERQPAPARLFSLLATAMRWHPFVRHDGPVSFRRAFRVSDWNDLLAGAGIPAHAAEIVRAFPARLCVERLR